MYNIHQNISDLCKNHYKLLLNLKNVIGVGLGHKVINFVNTAEPCIHVLVEKKVKSNYLSSNNIVPKTFMGIKTDVIEIGKSRFSSTSPFPMKIRPIECGCDITWLDEESEEDPFWGTLSCFVTKETLKAKEYYILSNNHVLADFNKVSIGTPIVQPANSPLDIAHQDIIANLSTFIPLKPTIDDKEPVNLVDCAIAKVIDKSLISNKIFQIGEIAGISKATLKLPIKKFGVTSGLTEGKVATINSTLNIEVSENEKYIFVDQIIGKLENDEGDSGSLILNDLNEAIGLYWGGTNNNAFSYINDISNVLDALNVKIYTGK